MTDYTIERGLGVRERMDLLAAVVAHVDFRTASVEGFSETGFDLAYARMVLEHLRDPAAMVARMTAAVALQVGAVPARCALEQRSDERLELGER